MTINASKARPARRAAAPEPGPDAQGCPADIDAYIAAAAPAAQPVLREIRRRVRQALPQARETISYRMPAFRLARTFFYFAAFKHHIGIYPPLRQDAGLLAELQPFANDKGNLGFPLARPIPYELIERVAVALARQYQSTGT